MRKTKKPYSVFQLASAAFMIAALLWLTVSTPFVYQFQQKQKTEQNKLAAVEQSPLADTNEEDSNLLGNATEEKHSNSNGNTLTEEYLHELQVHNHFFSIVSREHQSLNADTYVAFHGELHVPPPDLA